MNRRLQDPDLVLVRQCSEGSEEAWNRFYASYVKLVRNVVKRQWWVGRHEVEDLTQTAFLALISGIDGFRESGSLSGFVALVTERTCLQEYRKRVAGKRNAPEEPVDHHDGSEENARMIPSNRESQETALSKKRTSEMLRRALDAIDKKCRDLLRLRFFDELSYKELSEILNATENTLTVRARRCLDRLATQYEQLSVKGIR